MSAGLVVLTSRRRRKLSVTAPQHRRSAWAKIVAAVAAITLLSRVGYGHAQLLNPPAPVGQVLEEYRVALENKDLDQLTALYVRFLGTPTPSAARVPRERRGPYCRAGGRHRGAAR